MNDILITKYRKTYDQVLRPIALVLEGLIREHLEGDKVARIDRITARAKHPQRFLAKAQKVDSQGYQRYKEPFIQIQDLIGARVIVFYKNDISKAETSLKKYFRDIESQTIVPDSEMEFGYFGRHLIMVLPTDAIPRTIRREDAPKFFELQIKTLFQHAWSEAEHDLGYKFPEELSLDQKRKLAFTAAQAWGADEIFEELVAQLIHE